MKPIEQINLETIERYSKRYHNLGKDVKTLGWGSSEQQLYRFEQTLQVLDLTNKSILDLGCGFGDYANFLLSKGIKFKNYTGWDINPNLIAEAKKNRENNNVQFAVKNILEENFTSNESFDVVIMLGLLNFNLKEKLDNYKYSELFLTKAFQLTNEVMLCDFLSSNKTPDYPSEDFVFYHDPKKMLEFGFTLSSDVVVQHNYLPIPQKEFMLYIYK